jgi:hypothetical protein
MAFPWPEQGQPQAETSPAFVSWRQPLCNTGYTVLDLRNQRNLPYFPYRIVFQQMYDIHESIRFKIKQYKLK